MTLDARYPHLSRLVFAALGLTLEKLADRAPADYVPYFDLERLLAHVRMIHGVRLDADADMLFHLHHDQVRGYVATLEAFAALGVVRDPVDFVRKKLQAPRNARPTSTSSEMLDTLTECCWGLWLHDQFGNLIAERPFPSDHGDADFYVATPAGELWVDCLSPAPRDAQRDIAEYLASRVCAKWKDKFGARPSAATLRAGIAVSSLKGQEQLMPRLIFDEITEERYQAPDWLWTECPSLEYVWFGLQSWDAGAQRPQIVATWTRPRVPAGTSVSRAAEVRLEE